MHMDRLIRNESPRTTASAGGCASGTTLPVAYPPAGAGARWRLCAPPFASAWQRTRSQECGTEPVSAEIRRAAASLPGGDPAARSRYAPPPRRRPPRLRSRRRKPPSPWPTRPQLNPPSFRRRRRAPSRRPRQRNLPPPKPRLHLILRRRRRRPSFPMPRDPASDPKTSFLTSKSRAPHATRQT